VVVCGCQVVFCEWSGHCPWEMLPFEGYGEVFTLPLLFQADSERIPSD
jgi:hypothetical protein